MGEHHSGQKEMVASNDSSMGPSAKKSTEKVSNYNHSHQTKANAMNLV